MVLRQESQKISELWVESRHRVRKWDGGREGRKWRGASGWNELWLINVYTVLVASYFDSHLCFSLLAHLQRISCHYLKYTRLFSSQGLAVGFNCAWHGQLLFSRQISVCHFESKTFLDYLSAHPTFYNSILIFMVHTHLHPHNHWHYSHLTYEAWEDEKSKYFPQGHTTSSWQKQDLNSDPLFHGPLPPTSLLVPGVA